MAAPLSAALLNDTIPGVVADTQNTLSTTTSTTYVETFSAPAAVAFVAPASGIVLIENSAYLDHQTSATARTYLSWVLRRGSVIGSGTVVVAAVDATAIEGMGTNDATVGRTYMVGGLVPGGSYNLRQAGRTTSGTAEYQNRHLAVRPCPR